MMGKEAAASALDMTTGESAGYVGMCLPAALLLIPVQVSEWRYLKAQEVLSVSSCLTGKKIEGQSACRKLKRVAFVSLVAKSCLPIHTKLTS